MSIRYYAVNEALRRVALFGIGALALLIKLSLRRVTNLGYIAGFQLAIDD